MPVGRSAALSAFVQSSPLLYSTPTPVTVGGVVKPLTPSRLALFSVPVTASASLNLASVSEPPVTSIRGPAVSPSVRLVSVTATVVSLPALSVRLASVNVPAAVTRFAIVSDASVPPASASWVLKLIGSPVPGSTGAALQSKAVLLSFRLPPVSAAPAIVPICSEPPRPVAVAARAPSARRAMPIWPLVICRRVAEPWTFRLERRERPSGCPGSGRRSPRHR